MRPTIFVLAALAAAVPAASAQAATYTLQTDLTTIGGYSFASRVGANAHLDDTFRFTIGTAPADFGGFLFSRFRLGTGAISNLVAELTGGGINRVFTTASLGIGPIGAQFGFLDTTLPTSGMYAIRITGDTGAAGAAYSLDVAAAVPEPSEWAMMIAGLGIVGAIARRRRPS